MRISSKQPFRKRIDRYVRGTVLLDVLPRLSDYGLVLDVGCGDTPYTDLFVNLQYIGVDLNKRSKVAVLCDAAQLPFNSEIFDLVLASELLEHVSKPSLVLKEAYRVLRFDGHMVMTTRFLFPYHPEPTDYYRFTEEALTQLFEEADFRIVGLEREGGLLLLLANIFSSYGGGAPHPIKEITQLVASTLDLADHYLKIGSEYSLGFYVHAIKQHKPNIE